MADSTSLFRSTEEFCMRSDEFCRYIQDEVNPARKAAGLNEINHNDARVCFRVMDEFFAKWRAVTAGERHDE